MPVAKSWSSSSSASPWRHRGADLTHQQRGDADEQSSATFLPTVWPEAASVAIESNASVTPRKAETTTTTRCWRATWRTIGTILPELVASGNRCTAEFHHPDDHRLSKNRLSENTAARCHTVFWYIMMKVLHCVHDRNRTSLDVAAVQRRDCVLSLVGFSALQSPTACN